MVIRLFYGGRIMPERTRAEISLVFFKFYFNLPVGTGKKIEHTDNTAYASIIIFFRSIINRGSTIRSMADNTIIGFQSSTRPGTAHRNIAKLHDLVIVNERSPC